MRRPAFLAIGLLLTASLAPAQGVLFTVKPNVAPLGSIVLIIMENRSPSTIYLPALPPWTIHDSENQMVYSHPSLPVPTPIRPYEKFQWPWTQKDSNNKQVPAGVYEARAYLSFGGGSIRLKAKFTIKASAIVVSGTPQPGAQLTLALGSQQSAGLVYRVGLAFGTQPGLPLPGNRVFPLNPDVLFFVSQTVGRPFFQRFVGVLDANGQATAGIKIPNSTSLRGILFFTAFATFDPAAPGGIRTFSDATSIWIQ